MAHTTRRKPIPAPGRYKRPARTAVVEPSHVVQVDNLIFKFWTDNRHEYTYEGYVDVYAMVPDQDGLLDEDYAVHLISTAITSIDGETSMNIHTVAELIATMIRHTELVADHLYQTGHVEQVMAFEYVADDQAWLITHDIYLEVSADMEAHAPGWWVPRCTTCFGLHYEGEPHHADENHDERELISMCNYRVHDSPAGYQIGAVYYS